MLTLLLVVFALSLVASQQSLRGSETEISAKGGLSELRDLVAAKGNTKGSLAQDCKALCSVYCNAVVINGSDEVRVRETCINHNHNDIPNSHPRGFDPFLSPSQQPHVQHKADEVEQEEEYEGEDEEEEGEEEGPGPELSEALEGRALYAGMTTEEEGEGEDWDAEYGSTA